MSLGKRLEAVLATRDISLRDIAKQLEISVSTLSRIKNGKPVMYETGVQIDSWLRNAERVVHTESCEHCAGTGLSAQIPTYPTEIWVREPHGPDFATDQVFVEKRDIANCYARRGSHWIKYVIAEDQID